MALCELKVNSEATVSVKMITIYLGFASQSYELGCESRNLFKLVK